MVASKVSYWGIPLFFMLFAVSCASTKAYSGEIKPMTEVARIYPGTNHLVVDGRKTTESVLIFNVDDVSVGNYFKGYPKHCDVLPGERTIEVRHYQKWKDDSVSGAVIGGLLGGAIGGAIAGSVMESNNQFPHYKITFNAEPGQEYTIMPVTDMATMWTSIYVISSSGDTISTQIVQIIRQ